MNGKLLTLDRIYLVERADNWQHALALAAEPLLRDGSITQQYVEAMIGCVLRYGPYIVLADRFALAHANAHSAVNRVAMSFLQVKEPVDMLGRPVNSFLVLATPDNQSHMTSLARLAGLLQDSEHLMLLRTGSFAQVTEILRDI